MIPIDYAVHRIRKVRLHMNIDLTVSKVLSQGVILVATVNLERFKRLRLPQIHWQLPSLYLNQQSSSLGPNSTLWIGTFDDAYLLPHGQLLQYQESHPFFLLCSVQFRVYYYCSSLMASAGRCRSKQEIQMIRRRRCYALERRRAEALPDFLLL